jgi:subtilisin family serine protease
MVNGNPNPALAFKLRIAVSVLMILWMFQTSAGQEQNYSYFYRVTFRDKGDYSTNDFTFSELLSPGAIARRKRNGISIPDYHDIPVYNKYLKEISELGFTLHCKSKWMNSALFTTGTPSETEKLFSLNFVSDVKIVKTVTGKKVQSDKLSFISYESTLPAYDNPVEQINGLVIHKSGFTGKGILIAVMDAGFSNADRISSLTALHNRKGIRNTCDFVTGNDYVYDYHSHGTAVLSVLAGTIDGSIEGSAPEADFLLLRTEEGMSEFPSEEDFWIAAAEFADSCGADIITSSLGYFNFEDPSMNYEYSDLDGDAAFITRAADIAASRGIVVVNSVRNERDGNWNHIIAPSDGDSVLAVGAVDGNGEISSFSSPGPSSDGRIKPDVVAQGVSVPVQTKTDIVERANGTSFSCPVISGMCACIMQAVPDATASEIIQAIKASSDRFTTPDTLYGYGIPDMAKVINELQKKYLTTGNSGSSAGPNPFSDYFNIYFNENPERLRIEILNGSGIPVYLKNYPEFISRSIIINDINHLSEGLYFLRIYTSYGTFVHKLIKVSNRL